tara:strand:+ start:1736 stop:2974 length:1239 start_codon:yes stop_codon:yes gene_type:complete
MPGTTDTVKAMLTPGEFVIRKEAVDMIGVPILEKLNDMPEAGGHSEIDRLIAKATLKNMTGMYGGGMVNAKQYMGGGMVDQYMGGGMVDMYGHGGKVKNKMMSYEDGGQAMSNLKPVPDNNPGLAKLPEKVRNKMGYMQDGGLIGMMHGGKAKKKKEMYGYQEGGSVNMDDVLKRKMLMEQYSNVFDQNISLDDRFSNFTKAKMAMDKASGLFKDFKESETGYSASGNRGNLTDQEYFRGMRNLQNEKDMLLDMLKSSISSRQPEGMQEGGAVQDDAMMLQYLQSLQAQQANPFVPFDQRPPSSGEMMSPIPSGMEQGDMMRIIRDEREVLDMQDVELLRQKAQNALTRFQLDSLMQKATLDSLINQGSGDAMRIQRSPNETFSFPNTPAQENFMRKYKEEMIDPTYFPEGN